MILLSCLSFAMPLYTSYVDTLHSITLELYDETHESRELGVNRDIRTRCSEVRKGAPDVETTSCSSPHLRHLKQDLKRRSYSKSKVRLWLVKFCEKEGYHRDSEIAILNSNGCDSASCRSSLSIERRALSPSGT